jgi:predicted nucleic acid-binding protein
MLFLDANVFLRYLTQASTQDVAQMKIIAQDLIDHVATGVVEATTSEVVLHEICYVITSRNQYALSPGTAIQMLRLLLHMRGLTFVGNDKEIYLRALDLWEQLPKLEFPDSVIAARCE